MSGVVKNNDEQLNSIKSVTDQMQFTGGKLRTTGENGSGGGASSVNVDAGNRQRVSQLTSLGEYKNINDKIPDLKDEQGTGTSVHVSEDNGIFGTKMSVTPGQWVVRESKYSHFYNSGESHFIEFTTQNFIIEANVTKRIGYFSSNTVSPFDSNYDGIWIESNGDDNEYYVSSFREGVQVLKEPRSGWDDPLDGTGPSGKTVDFSVFNIFQFDFLWLGGSAIRFACFVDGEFILFHTYRHAGVQQGIICRSPHQPIRYEIRSTTGSGFLYDVCSQISTEGSQNTVGLPRAVDLEELTLNANIIGSYYLIAAVRLNPNRRNSIINIAAIGGFATTNDSFRLTLFKNPTIANIPAWQDYSASSALQYILGDAVSNPSNTTVTGGEKLKTFGVSLRRGDSELDIKDVLFKLSRLIDGTSDVYALAATPLTPNLDLAGQIELIEKI